MTEPVRDLAAEGWTEHRVAGFSALAGPFYTRVVDGVRRFAVVVEDRHLNGGGIAHGGMLMTFIDQSIGMCVWEAIGRKPCATIQLDTHFVAAARSGDLVEAWPEVVRMTRSVVFTRGELRRGGETLLTAAGIWKIISPAVDRPPPKW